MTTRSRFTERQVIYTLLLQGAVIPCGICRVAIKLGEDVERDHCVPLALDGADTPENSRFAHATCHARKTRGSGATTCGSDIGEISKTRRLERKRYPKPSWAKSQVTRETGLVEDVCEHDVGHPNTFWLMAHPGMEIRHGCDGCCSLPNRAKPKRKWPARPFQRRETRT